MTRHIAVLSAIKKLLKHLLTEVAMFMIDNFFLEYELNSHHI